nr:hypothetical protein [Vibrio cidicii]
MNKLNGITLTLTSVMFSGYLHAANTTSSDVTVFVPGETKVQNGQMVSYNGECFIAKNNPGVWETPKANSWFWDLDECSGDVNPEPEPEPNPDPIPDPSDIIAFIPGQTQVKNGDVVSYGDQCFIAKNNPGVWETPSSGSWFLGCNAVFNRT